MRGAAGPPTNYCYRSTQDPASLAVNLRKKSSRSFAVVAQGPRKPDIQIAAEDDVTSCDLSVHERLSHSDNCRNRLVLESGHHDTFKGRL